MSSRIESAAEWSLVAEFKSSYFLLLHRALVRWLAISLDLSLDRVTGVTATLMTVKSLVRLVVPQEGSALMVPGALPGGPTRRDGQRGCEAELAVNDDRRGDP